MGENNKRDIDRLKAALENGEDFNEVALAVATGYMDKLRRTVYPLEPWAAPFVVAALKRLVAQIEKDIPGSELAAADLLAMLADEEKSHADG